MGHNELLIREALQSQGPRRGHDQRQVPRPARRRRRLGGDDGRAQAVKNFLAYTLNRLGTDHVYIDRLARTDPNAPIEETVGAIRALVDAGHVRDIGLSESSADVIQARRGQGPISDRQSNTA